MKGGMQNVQLNVTQLLDYAAKWHPEQEVITKTVEGDIVISTYAQAHRRAKLFAWVLKDMGVRAGDLVATLAWNTVRHLEVWYGIMGVAGVCHTLNPRLSDRDLKYIANDAGDIVLISDITFVGILERILPEIPTIRAVIFLTDRQHMPHNPNLPSGVVVHCYEELIASYVQQPPFSWIVGDENEACGLCYTSGTTGNPKGVLYSHRSQYLHALLLNTADTVPLSSNTTVMAIVPMFHANVWGMVFAAPMVGARLVLPGPWLDGESIYNMMERFEVNVSAGVPTVWLNLLAHVDSNNLRFSSLKRVVIGGAAASRAMIDAFEDKYGVEVLHIWGMTELSPVGTHAAPKMPIARAGREKILATKCTQGRPHVLVDMRIVGEGGKEMPHDGKAVGNLQVRGPFVVGQYFRIVQPPTCDLEGWFSTGDVATIDPLGHVTITDRSKDVVKSGGEWISSIQIENAAAGHPAVQEAAVIAVPDAKWGERPLLLIVPRAHVWEELGASASHSASNSVADGFEKYAVHPDRARALDDLKQEILNFLSDKIARFAMPDDVVFLHEIPHNATGKVSKLTLRDAFKNYKPPRPRL